MGAEIEITIDIYGKVLENQELSKVEGNEEND
jgi:hypothetical protein